MYKSIPTSSCIIYIIIIDCYTDNNIHLLYFNFPPPSLEWEGGAGGGAVAGSRRPSALKQERGVGGDEVTGTLCA